MIERTLIRRYVGRAFLIGLLASALPACSDDPTGNEEDQVVIGGLFSLTGNWSTLGKTGKAALELAVEDVNGYLDGSGSRLRFVAEVEDTRLDPSSVVSKATALRAKGAQVVIGPQSSAEVAVLKPYADANALLVVSPSSTAGSLAIAGDNVFRFTPSDSLEGIAISALMWVDGVRAVVPVWRADAGNQGLHVATRARMTNLGAFVAEGTEYETTITDFSSVATSLSTRVQQTIAAHGVEKTAVYLAAFDEAAGLLEKAAGDPVLSNVPWYGSDGVVLSQALLDNAAAAAFAVDANYPNPIFGLSETTRDAWEGIAVRIRTRAGLDPDAFALAVYDAVWVAAKSYLATGPEPALDVLKKTFVATAAFYFGTTGWTRLNAAGDRLYADFDFWGIRGESGSYEWRRVAQYQSQTGVLRR